LDSVQGTQKLELVYGGEKIGLEGYVDADGASQEHRHVISSFIFLIDGGAISWSSKKQELVTSIQNMWQLLTLQRKPSGFNDLSERYFVPLLCQRPCTVIANQL
jgi:hypothetical protein